MLSVLLRFFEFIERRNHPNEWCWWNFDGNRRTITGKRRQVYSHSTPTCFHKKRHQRKFREWNIAILYFILPSIEVENQQILISLHVFPSPAYRSKLSLCCNKRIILSFISHNCRQPLAAIENNFISFPSLAIKNEGNLWLWNISQYLGKGRKKDEMNRGGIKCI